MTVTARRFVDLMLTQDGDRYVFGAEASPSDDNPSAFDCSEIIEWAAARLGVTPPVPDGSWYQYRHCVNHQTTISVSEAVDTAGALLFYFKGDPLSGGRPSSAHVAVSQGNGKTIEARSTRHGVGQFDATNRSWTHAGLIPGVDYQTGRIDDMLKPGDRGPSVALYQRAICLWAPSAAADLYTPEGKPFGVYGPLTEEWVKRYQTAAGLTPTGRVDGITAANLARYVPAHDHGKA